MRSKGAVIVAALLCSLSAAVVASGEPGAGSSGGRPTASVDCDVGGVPTHPYGARPPEEFLTYRTRPVVIGCAQLPGGRRFELVGYQLAHGKRSSLCIDQYDFDTGVTWGCGSNVVRGGGVIDATSTEHTRGHVPVVAGTAAASVARVVVRSEIDKRLRRHPVALVHVRGRGLLRAIGVPRPFGRYLAEIPAGARAASAQALGARGRTRGLAFFPGFRGPVGEGRTCFGRPRVVRLRLLDPARLGRESRLRVVAAYRGGHIGSMDVSVSGRGGAHADLAPAPRRADGRRVVTLPVSFPRRGTAGIDVTAEGLPSGRRCGDLAVLRRSDIRTLAVRVK